MGNMIKFVLGRMTVMVRVVPPTVRLHKPGKQGGYGAQIAEAKIPIWARNIILSVDMNLPPGGNLSVTAAEVAALLH
jgi:hypothetical protein